ncbi:hypothetical protein P884DRAFT_246506 [Thermothelomyces heterothallicus CBS 202.75]
MGAEGENFGSSVPICNMSQGLRNNIGRDVDITEKYGVHTVLSCVKQTCVVGTHCCSLPVDVGEEREERDEEQKSGRIIKMDGEKEQKKTYSTGDSPVVTDLSTSPAVSSLSRGERTGSRVLYCLWPYVLSTAASWN